MKICSFTLCTNSNISLLTFVHFDENKQIVRSRKQRLINRKGHRHAVNEGMDS